jgi:hypothetical protein
MTDKINSDPEEDAVKEFYADIFQENKNLLFLNNVGLTMALQLASPVNKDNIPNFSVRHMKPLRKFLIVNYQSGGDRWGSPCPFTFSYDQTPSKAVITYELVSEKENYLNEIMKSIDHFKCDVILFDIESILWTAMLGEIDPLLEVITQLAVDIRSNLSLPICFASPIDELPNNFFESSDIIWKVDDGQEVETAMSFILRDVTDKFKKRAAISDWVSRPPLPSKHFCFTGLM